MNQDIWACGLNYNIQILYNSFHTLIFFIFVTLHIYNTVDLCPVDI